VCTAPGKSWCEKNGVSGLEMNRFDATKPTIDARDESIADSMTRLRDSKDIVNRHLQRIASSGRNPESALRDASEADDRQVLPPSARRGAR